MMRPNLFSGVVLAVLFAFARHDVSAQGGQGLGGVVLDSVEFSQTDLASALEYLTVKAEERNPNVAPVNLLLIDPDKKLRDKAITLKLNSVPWSSALKYTCDLAGVTAQRDGSVIVVGEKAAVQRMAMQRSKIVSGPGSENAKLKLASTMVESVNFDDASLVEIADYLRLITAPVASSRGGTAMNVLIKENIQTPVATRQVSMKLRQVSMAELLHFATGLANCRFRIDARAVVIGDAADLTRAPGGPRRPTGHIFNRLAATTIDSIDIPAGSEVAEFLEVIRTLGGVNGIAMTDDAVAASRLMMNRVSALELLRYFNEVSGTAYRLEQNAFIIADDPAVPKKPRPPEALVPKAPVGRGPAGLGFDP